MSSPASKPLNNVSEIWGAAFDNGQPGSFVKELSELCQVFANGSAKDKRTIPFMEKLLSFNGTSLKIGRGKKVARALERSSAQALEHSSARIIILV